MSDAFADSSTRLERLLELATNENDPIKCDELAAEIRGVPDERELLGNRLRNTTEPTKNNP